MEPEVITVKSMGRSGAGKTTLWEYIGVGRTASGIASTQGIKTIRLDLPLYQEDAVGIGSAKVKFGMIPDAQQWAEKFMLKATEEYGADLEKLCRNCNYNGVRINDKIVAKKEPYVFYRIMVSDIGGQSKYDGQLKENCEYWVNQKKPPISIFSFFKAEEIDKEQKDLLGKITGVSGVLEELGSHIYNFRPAVLQLQNDVWPTVDKAVYDEFRKAINPKAPEQVPFLSLNATRMPRKEVIYNVLAVALP